MLHRPVIVYSERLKHILKQVKK